MVTEAELSEYLDEIRQEVCSRCVERPSGGPPCAPLGKMCGVELHLADLIDSIHQVRSNFLEPYLNHNRQEVCEKCAFLHSSFCPCPMDYLALLIVQAVETVDARRGPGAEPARGTRNRRAEVGVEEIRRAYQEAVGAWTGCDWATCIGKTGLNLQGWTALRARAMFLEAEDPVQVQDWLWASHWLTRVERHAQQAEAHAAEAVQAAAAGRWRDALTAAESAWALEFATGRPLRHGPRSGWLRLREVIEVAYLQRAADADTN